MRHSSIALSCVLRQKHLLYGRGYDRDPMASIADLDQIDALGRSASAAARAGDHARAVTLARQAAAALRQAAHPGMPRAADLAARLAGLGLLCCAMQQWAEARVLLGEAEAAFATLPEVPVPHWIGRMRSLAALATAHRFDGDAIGAADALGAGAAWAEAMVAGSTEHDHRLELAQFRNAFGDALLDAGRSEAALQVLSLCAADVARLAGDKGADRGGVGLDNLHAAVLNKLGRAELAAGQPTAALDRFEQSVAIMRRLVEVEGHADLREDLEAASADLQRMRSECH